MNGKPIENDCDELGYYDLSQCCYTTLKELAENYEIESIVTHEQFNSIKYEVI